MSTASNIRLTSVVAQSREPIATQIDGEVVMVSVEQGNYYGLDVIGSRIWELLEQPCSVATLCDRLQQEFTVDRLTCEQDVLEFLAKLAAEKLIRVGDEIPHQVS